MEVSITDKWNTIEVIDRSDETGFEFGFICGICGYEWTSERVPFDFRFATMNLDEMDRELLWGEGFRRAFERAKEDAAIEFNRCPECGTWVCDNCFFVTDEELTDVCVDCVKGDKMM